MIDSQPSINNDILFFMKTLNMLEAKHNSIKNEIKQKKQIEIDRIFKEFFLNEYTRRFNTTEEIVISALIGEDNINKEMNRKKVELKVL